MVGERGAMSQREIDRSFLPSGSSMRSLARGVVPSRFLRTSAQIGEKDGFPRPPRSGCSHQASGRTNSSFECADKIEHRSIASDDAGRLRTGARPKRVEVSARLAHISHRSHRLYTSAFFDDIEQIAKIAKNDAIAHWVCWRMAWRAGKIDIALEALYEQSFR